MIPNLYKEDRKPSPGEREVRTGSTLVQIFRLFGVAMPLPGDVEAVRRTGELLRRRLRQFRRKD